MSKTEKELLQKLALELLKQKTPENIDGCHVFEVDGIKIKISFEQAEVLKLRLLK